MRLRLAFRTGHHAGQQFECAAPRTLVLGRASTSDLQIYDERISRRHCAIRVDADRVRLKDLESGNGTFVNGAEIRETVLADGDVVSIGRTEMAVHLVGPPIPAPPAGPPQPVRPDTPTDPLPRAAAARPSLSGSQQGQAEAGEAQPCALCSSPVPPAHLKLAGRFRGRYLCFTCAPRPAVQGYRLERNLGEGAMGIVFLALNERTQAPVAIKVLKTKGELTSEDRARFVREVQTSVSLQHPNIVRVLHHGEAPPFLYYVMEYVPGRSLKEWIDAYGPLPLPSALRVATQVAEALEHARACNVVHRDIKPENIMVQGDGHAKLADFGLAKSTLSSGASGLTRPGDGLGTLPYMPPEQIQDALHADHRADIYSFGATIYHMLAARPPFTGKTPIDFFRSITSQEPPPISGFRSDVPEVLQRMISRSMAKRPEDRFQTVREMQVIMQQFLRTEFDSRQTAS